MESFETKQSKGIKPFDLVTRSKETSLLILLNLNIDSIFRLLLLDFRLDDMEHAVLHLSFDLHIELRHPLSSAWWAKERKRCAGKE